MAVLNPEHLFEQAEKLIIPPPAGPPRQTDVRRAISAAYYGAFHFITTAAADDIVGAIHRATPRYALVYRSVDHRILRALCEEVAKQTLVTKYRKYFPAGSAGPYIQAFANAVVELQEKRHSADYDPIGLRRTLDAKLAIATARTAIQRFNGADQDLRKMFLALLLFPPR